MLGKHNSLHSLHPHTGSDTLMKGIGRSLLVNFGSNIRVFVQRQRQGQADNTSTRNHKGGGFFLHDEVAVVLREGDLSQLRHNATKGRR